MTDFRKIPLRFPSGNMTWDSFAPWFETWQREVAARQDPRNPNNDFADAFVASNDGTAVIGESATVTSQRSIPTVNAGSKLSAQNIAPLSSEFDVTATITIAAHTVQYGFGEVSYGGGSISGLPEDTVYYIYADDPGKDGGVMSYVATTDATEIVAANERYFVGSIRTATAGSPTTGGGGGGWDYSGIGAIP